MKIIVPIAPQQQERPRYAKRGRFVQVYDPKKTKIFKQQLGQFVKQYMRENELQPFTEPIVVSVIFYRPLQKSISRVEKQRRLGGIHPPSVKPDVSNYLKSFEDGLNGVLWKDDALIIKEIIEKRYSENPHLEIEVTEWSEHYGNTRQETNHDVPTKRE